jgi:hypothetical protein
MLTVDEARLVVRNAISAKWIDRNVITLVRHGKWVGSLYGAGE